MYYYMTLITSSYAHFDFQLEYPTFANIIGSLSSSLSSSRTLTEHYRIRRLLLVSQFSQTVVSSSTFSSANCIVWFKCTGHPKVSREKARPITENSVYTQLLYWSWFSFVHTSQKVHNIQTFRCHLRHLHQ